MPTHFARHILVSTLVLGSVGTLADAALAEERSPVMIPFSCTTPIIGADRCGDKDQNLRIGPESRLTVDWTTSDNKEACVTFVVVHAVSGKELASEELCEAPKAKPLWTNPEKKFVDVYVTVKSDKASRVKIGGFYIIYRP
jgi:hypothetical protein